MQNCGCARTQTAVGGVYLEVPRRGRPLSTILLSGNDRSTIFRVIHGRRHGHEAELGTTPEETALLLNRGILVEPSEVSRLPECRAALTDITVDQENVASAATTFEKNGYCVLEPMFSADVLIEISKYYSECVSEGWLPLGDGQSERYWKHNDEIGRRLQELLLPLVLQVVRQPIMPSYTYFTHYVHGATLPSHVDRPQCKYTLSLCLDFPDSAKRRAPWPLCLHSGPSEVVELNLRRGQAVLYRGCNIRHSRPRLEEAFLKSLLIHYVDTTFDGPLE